MKKTCKICVCLEPEVREKAGFLARRESRTLSGHLRHLLHADIRRYEREHGPIDAKQAPT